MFVLLKVLLLLARSAETSMAPFDVCRFSDADTSNVPRIAALLVVTSIRSATSRWCPERRFSYSAKAWRGNGRHTSTVTGRSDVLSEMWPKRTFPETVRKTCSKEGMSVLTSGNTFFIALTLGKVRAEVKLTGSASSRPSAYDGAWWTGKNVC